MEIGKIRKCGKKGMMITVPIKSNLQIGQVVGLILIDDNLLKFAITKEEKSKLYFENKSQLEESNLP